MTTTTDPLHAGLTTAQASVRLAHDGRNELQRSEGRPAWRAFLDQFRNVMVWLLLGACGISAVLGDVVDAIAIGAIVLLNAIVGFLQEHRAERAVLALRAMTAPHARVVRDGIVVDVPAVEVVVDDLLVLEAGDLVAADAVVVDAARLSANEAALTGESAPVDKVVGGTSDGAPLAEQRGHVFMGTAIATGSGRARVTSTGMDTELGRVAHLLETAQVTQTPLQHRLEKVGRTLLWLCLGVVVVVAALGFLHGEPWQQVLLSAVSLAVASVPEGLAAIVTIALAVGVQRLATKHVLVRRLPAVETLGTTTVICTDKTGTLTTGVMAVRELRAGDGVDDDALLHAAAACCDAELHDDGSAIGDPTEIALLVAAKERAIVRADIERAHPRVAVHPFDADRKRMSILRDDGVLYVKGAVDLLVPLCTSGTARAVDDNAAMAARGLRVLAIARGTDREERDLELMGLVGIADPPRKEAIDAVAAARRAGIRTVMITGDHPVTAAAIAREMGIVSDDEEHDGRVHARATPEDKLRIVRAWKERGAVVAMTGDGVNDAPALREAHIGIAMGRSGTEVTREAAAMVLTDDNFASIVDAVREGRGIYANIRNALVYLLAGNAGELFLMLGASIAGLPLPLTPLQLLWINLVTDGLPALALVTEPAPQDALDAPPRAVDEPMVGKPEWRRIVATGLLEAALVVGAFVSALPRGLDEARTVAFTVLVCAEVLRAFAARSARFVLFEVGAFTNVRLLVVVVASVLVQLGLVLWPVTQRLFHLTTLDARELALALALGLIPVTALELAKLVARAGARHGSSATRAT